MASSAALLVVCVFAFSLSPASARALLSASGAVKEYAAVLRNIETAGYGKFVEALRLPAVDKVVRQVLRAGKPISILAPSDYGLSQLQSSCAIDLANLALNHVVPAELTAKFLAKRGKFQIASLGPATIVKARNQPVTLALAQDAAARSRVVDPNRIAGERVTVHGLYQPLAHC